jgi:hypothetical protein
VSVLLGAFRFNVSVTYCGTAVAVPLHDVATPDAVEQLTTGRLAEFT